MTARVVVPAIVPVALTAPEAMWEPVRQVLAGEYESGHSGSGLTVLDIGANVGAFAIWAHLRWPQSTIHAYEPHPGTFAMLGRNVAPFPNVRAHNAAIFPTDASTLPLFSRYPGDGEAGLVRCMGTTFENLSIGQISQVSVVHPSSLPQADVLKLDVEGAEADILEHMDLANVSLVLLEYQHDSNRERIKRLLSLQEMTLVREDVFEWRDLLDYSAYRRDLAGDHYGHLVFSAPRSTRLTRSTEP